MKRTHCPYCGHELWLGRCPMCSHRTRAGITAGILIASCLMVAGCLLPMGCASYQYGPASVRSFGVDPTVKHFTWSKTDTNGTEVISIEGAKRTGGEAGTHVLGNVAAMLIGAAFGTAVNPGAGTAVGAAKGAAIGGGAAEIWQTVKDWISKRTGAEYPSGAERQRFH